MTALVVALCPRAKPVSFFFLFATTMFVATRMIVTSSVDACPDELAIRKIINRLHLGIPAMPRISRGNAASVSFMRWALTHRDSSLWIHCQHT